MPHEIKRPNCERAHSFQAGICGEFGCGGLHLIAYRRDDAPICELILSREAVRDLLALIHDQGLDL
jgi:hypothetical protein